MSTVTAVPIAPVKRGYLVWLWIGIALALVGAAALAMAGVGSHRTKSGLVYQVLRHGKGTEHPTDTDVALVNYEGRLTDGTVFDRSQQPTPMPVAGVVPGFGEGLKLMTKGSRYRLRIPPALGYGARANGPIPANSTLVFDVELVDFLSEEKVRQLQEQQMMQQQMMQQLQGQGGPGGAPGALPPGLSGAPAGR